MTAATLSTNQAQGFPIEKSAASPGFVKLLAELDISLALSSYQSGKFYLIGRHPKGGLSLHERLFQRAMGIYAENNTLLLATLFQIHKMENVLEPGQNINNIYETCYIPRVSYTTGALDIHDIAMLNGEVIFINTKFNCLAKLSERNSFTPVWKPFFIDKLIAEDRCHLNGMAIDNGKITHVTAVSETNSADAWRDHRANGGIVIDVEKNAIICRNLSMPHSPRIHNGKLWILNAGTGELGTIDQSTNSFTPLCFLPGFGRGLAFHGKYAFIGLSKPRYKRFEGLKIGEQLEATNTPAFCGIQVIDIETGKCVEWFKTDSSVIEIFDVAILKGKTCAMSLGFNNDEILSFVSHD